MNWVYEQLFNKNTYILKKGTGNHKKIAKKLKYCESCEHVWEISVEGGIIKYMHLPKYKLYKKICRMCK